MTILNTFFLALLQPVRGLCPRPTDTCTDDGSVGHFHTTTRFLHSRNNTSTHAYTHAHPQTVAMWVCCRSSMGASEQGETSSGFGSVPLRAQSRRASYSPIFLIISHVGQCQSVFALALTPISSIGNPCAALPLFFLWQGLGLDTKK